MDVTGSNGLEELPTVSDEDIRWAERQLGLPEGALLGEGGETPRIKALKSLENLDVSACPGSGKTTLLVSKLAILANKWRHETRGICVLSHTNVARTEVETRLGRNGPLRALLSYPHFIGTIQSFVDGYLALPWLRSRGFPVKMIDAEECGTRRWQLLTRNTRFPLENKGIGPFDIRVTDSDFNWTKTNGIAPFSTTTQTYKNVQAACRQIAELGFHTYADMFVWASDLLDHHPAVISAIRCRFPLLFIDESQDTSDQQAALLHRLFRGGAAPIVRQRFGDQNQAIFDTALGKEAAIDQFPDPSVRLDIPDSYRFGQKIADLADPLGVTPYGMQGLGPHPAPPGPTIFLFEDGAIGKVLPAYGQLLLDAFSDVELASGTFVAVGQVHSTGSETPVPHHVGHYWPDYQPEFSRQDPRPTRMAEYFRVGLQRAELAGESFPAVEKIAEGILRLAARAANGRPIEHARYKHRYLVGLLSASAEAQSKYDSLIRQVVLKRTAPTKEEWEGGVSAAVRSIAEVAGRGPVSQEESASFLAWSDLLVGGSPETHSQSRSNRYLFTNEGREAPIRVGSIHSVKGETHTATLVLDTYWYESSLPALLPWLVGSQAGKTQAKERQRTRLKIHYVAMTRPTRLLCLALREAAVSDADEQLLNNRGWHLTHLKAPALI